MTKKPLPEYDKDGEILQFCKASDRQLYVWQNCFECLSCGRCYHRSVRIVNSCLSCGGVCI